MQASPLSYVCRCCSQTTFVQACYNCLTPRCEHALELVRQAQTPSSKFSKCVHCAPAGRAASAGGDETGWHERIPAICTNGHSHGQVTAGAHPNGALVHGTCT
jgi:hypothetical protein